MSKTNRNLKSTGEFVELLKNNNELLQIDDPVDPNLELAQIHREICKRKGPAILFTNVKGTQFPVATNLYGSTSRLELAFGQDPIRFIENLADTALNIMPPNMYLCHISIISINFVHFVLILCSLHLQVVIVGNRRLIEK